MAVIPLTCLLSPPLLIDTDIRSMGKLRLLAKWVENQMFNVLLEHFVVSPEILRLKQRMFFVLYWEACFLLEKKYAMSSWIVEVSTEMS